MPSNADIRSDFVAIYCRKIFVILLWMSVILCDTSLQICNMQRSRFATLQIIFENVKNLTKCLTFFMSEKAWPCCPSKFVLLYLWSSSRARSGHCREKEGNKRVPELVGRPEASRDIAGALYVTFNFRRGFSYHDGQGMFVLGCHVI